MFLNSHFFINILMLFNSPIKEDLTSSMLIGNKILMNADLLTVSDLGRKYILS